MMVRFRNFYNLQKVKIWVKKGQKGAMRFKQQVQRFTKRKTILGLGALHNRTLL